MQLKKNDSKKIYAFSVATKILLVFIGLITSALISRGLGVDLKGEYTYLVNISSVVVIIATLGIGQTYSFFVRQYGNKYRSIFINLNYFQFLVLVLICFIFLLLDINSYYYIMLLASVGMFRDNFVYLSTVENIKQRNIINLISKVIYLFTIILGYTFFKYHLNVFLYLLILDEVVFSIIMVLKYRFLPTKTNFLSNEKKMVVKKIYKLGIISMITLLLTTLNYSIDVIILKFISTTTSVGLYSIGNSLASMLWIIPDAFKEVILSKTSKDDSVKDIIFSLKCNIFISLIIIIGFILVGKYFICLIYGNEYINSYLTTIILLIGSLSMIFHKIISPLLYSKGLQKKLCIIFLEAVILNTFLNFILIPKYDIIGAAISSVFSYTLAGGLILKIFVKMYNLKIKDVIFIKLNDIKLLVKKVKGV